MELTQNDKDLLKHVNLTETEFLKLSEIDQKKQLKKAFDASLKSRFNKRKPELIENAKSELPKIKKQFEEKQIIVYATGVGQNKGEAEYLLVGFVKGKYILVNQKSESDKIKFYQVDENQIIKSIE